MAIHTAAPSRQTKQLHTRTKRRWRRCVAVSDWVDWHQALSRRLWLVESLDYAGGERSVIERVESSDSVFGDAITPCSWFNPSRLRALVEAQSSRNRIPPLSADNGIITFSIVINISIDDFCRPFVDFCNASNAQHGYNTSTTIVRKPTIRGLNPGLWRGK